MAKKFFSLFPRILIVLSILLLCAALFLNISTLFSLRKIINGRSVQSGYACAVVGSGSMEPAISVNDLVIIKGAGSYREHDVVTYVSDGGTLITHRIKQVSDSGYITQGDANNTPDSEISRQRFMGKVVFAVPGVGLIFKILLSPAGLLFSIGFPVGLILLFRLTGNKKENRDDTA